MHHNNSYRAFATVTHSIVRCRAEHGMPAIPWQHQNCVCMRRVNKHKQDYATNKDAGARGVRRMDADRAYALHMTGKQAQHSRISIPPLGSRGSVAFHVREG